jgi:histone-lysine N-methyltransferase SETMAR
VSIENDTKSGRKVSISTKLAEARIQELLLEDARYTVRELAKLTGVSSSTVHFILKKQLKVRKITARWIPHLLTVEQKRSRVQCARKILKMAQKMEKNNFSDLVTGDETWIYFYEPHRKMSNKVWATKAAKRPCIAKRTMSVRKMLYAIFFTARGPAIQVPVPKGRGITGKFYRDVVLKKLDKYFVRIRPKSGMRHIKLLHDNAPAHKAAIVTDLLAGKHVIVLQHPPYSPDLSPSYFFLFPRLKKMLAGRKYSKRPSVGSAIYQCLISIPTKDYIRAFQMWLKRLKICIQVQGEYFEGMH